jgi:hypothetical protein
MIFVKCVQTSELPVNEMTSEAQEPTQPADEIVIKLRPPSIAKKEMKTKYLSKFQNPRAITRPKIIGPEQNVQEFRSDWANLCTLDF